MVSPAARLAAQEMLLVRDRRRGPAAALSAATREAVGLSTSKVVLADDLRRRVPGVTAAVAAVVAVVAGLVREGVGGATQEVWELGVTANDSSNEMRAEVEVRVVVVLVVGFWAEGAAKRDSLVVGQNLMGPARVGGGVEVATAGI